MIHASVELATCGSLPSDKRCQISKTTNRYGKAFARFDVDEIADLLSDDVVLESQMVLKPREGKANVLAHLKKRFAYLKENLAGVLQIIPGEVSLPMGANYPCLILQRGDIRDALLSLTLDEKGKVKRIDFLIVLPTPGQANPTGEKFSTAVY